MLNAAMPLRAMLCALLVSVLSACGGGGGGSDKPAQPKADTSSVSTGNTLSVEGGNSAVPVGRYDVDTSNAKPVVYDAEQLAVVYPAAPQFASAFIFSQSHPDKFAVFFADSLSTSAAVFACRSNSSNWTSTEIAALKGTAASAASIALCPSSIIIDPVAHSIQVTGLKMPDVTATGKSVTLSASFSWASTVTVETGSNIVALRTYTVTGGAGGSQAYGDLILDQAKVETSAVSVTLMRLQGHEDKFILNADTVSTGGATTESYACASTAWTSDELTKLKTIYNASLTTCPDSVSYNATNRLLALNKAVLPVIAGVSGHQLVLSLSEFWAMPSFPTSTGSSPTGSTASPL
ncbi:MAG: hypothetical protein QM749_19075 [Aquabacterium sp.]